MDFKRKLFFLTFLSSISITSLPVAANQCAEVNGNWNGTLTFNGFVMGSLVTCYADVKAQANTTVDGETDIVLSWDNCQCNNYRTGCYNMAYMVRGTCINNQIKVKRSDFYHGWYQGTIWENVIELKTEDNWWIKLYK